MKKMTLKEFLYAYADNMADSIESHEFSLHSLGINCTACPFREQCHNDESGLNCEQFIQSLLEGGKLYRAK